MEPPTLTIILEEAGIISIEGIRCSIDILKRDLNDPPKGLFSVRREVRREGDALIFTRFDTLEKCVEHFKP